MAASDEVIYENGGLACENFGGGLKVLVVKPFDLSGSDEANSVFRLAKVNPNDIPVELHLLNAAELGLTDVDFGLCQIGKTASATGSFFDADVLADGVSFASAHVVGSELTILSNVALADFGKSFAELAGITAADYTEGLELIMKIKGASTAATTVSVTGILVEGV